MSAKLRNITIAILPLLAGVILFTQPVSAAYYLFGRSLGQGYFTGNPSGSNADKVFSDHALYNGKRFVNIRSASEFKQAIQVFLNGDAAYDNSACPSGVPAPCWWGAAQETRGAAFIVDTMLGRPGTSFGSVASGITYAQNNISAWKNLVDQYDAAGNVSFPHVTDWSTSTWTDPSTGKILNTEYIPGTGDERFFDESPSDVSATWAIVFTNPDGTKYAVKMNCGNPIGTIHPLSQGGTIQGFKVDTNGSATGAYAGDKISAGSVSDTSNSYKLIVPVGNVTVKDNDASGVTLKGYAWCNSSPGCSPGHDPATATHYTAFTGSNWPTSGTNSFPKINAGDIINLYWIYTPGGGGACGTPGNPACPTPTLSCAALPGVNITAVPMSTYGSWGSGNNGETTYSPNGGDKHTPPPGFPGDGDSVTVRNVDPNGYKIVKAQDVNTGDYLPVNASNNTINFTDSVAKYPYDANSARVWYTDTYTATTTTYSKDKDGNVVANDPTTSGSMTSETYPNSNYPSATYGSATLGECSYRDFMVTATSTSISLNDNENPSSATTSNGVKVEFLLPDVGGTKQVRAPMQIKNASSQPSQNLTYTETYQIIRSGDSSCTVTLGTPTYTFPTIGPATTSGQQVALNPSQSETLTGLSVGAGSTQFRPGDKACAHFTTQYGQGQIDENGNIVSGSCSPSSLCPASSINSTSPTAQSQVVVNKPYFKVFGGGISVGSNFKTPDANGIDACSANVPASVYGWNTANSSIYGSEHYAGSGAQFTVMELVNGTVKGVASDQNNTNAQSASSRQDGTGWSFANEGLSGSSGTFAKGTVNANDCIPDYYGTLPSSTATDTSHDAFSIQPSTGGIYSFKPSGGLLTIEKNSGADDNPITIGTGEDLTVYVDGNVYIKGGVEFQGDSGSGWSSINDIPSFTLIVKGNIYVDPGATRLDGIYIAQPNSGLGGDIYDCGTSTGAAVSSDSMFDVCKNRLTINGSFIANKIYLMRTGEANIDPSDTYRINPSLRGAHTNETNAESSTRTFSATPSSTCADGSTPPSSGICGNATPHTSSTSGSSYAATSYDSYSCPGGTYDWLHTCYSVSCGAGESAYEGICYDNWTGHPVGPQSGFPDTRTTNYYCPYGGSLSGTTCNIPGTSYTYYTCPSGESVSGNKCTVPVTYTCPSGAVKSGDQCTVTITPTNATEVFNFGPAFWMDTSLPQPAYRQHSYDAITSLPPVL